MTLRAALLETESARRITAALGNATLTWGAYTSVGIKAREFVERLGIAARSTTFHAEAVDLPGIAQGASVSVDGTAYTVRAVEPDAAGLVILVLEAA